MSSQKHPDQPDQPKPEEEPNAAAVKEEEKEGGTGEAWGVEELAGQGTPESNSSKLSPAAKSSQEPRAHVDQPPTEDQLAAATAKGEAEEEEPPDNVDQPPPKEEPSAAAVKEESMEKVGGEAWGAAEGKTGRGPSEAPQQPTGTAQAPSALLSPNEEESGEKASATGELKAGPRASPETPGPSATSKEPKKAETTGKKAMELFSIPIIQRKITRSLWMKPSHRWILGQEHLPAFLTKVVAGQEPNEDFPADDLADFRRDYSPELADSLNAFLLNHYEGPTAAASGPTRLYLKCVWSPPTRLYLTDSHNPWPLDTGTRLVKGLPLGNLRRLHLDFFKGEWPCDFESGDGEEAPLRHLSINVVCCSLMENPAGLPAGLALDGLQTLRYNSRTPMMFREEPHFLRQIGRMRTLRKLVLFIASTVSDERGDLCDAHYRTSRRCWAWVKESGLAGQLETIVSDFEDFRPSDFPSLRRLGLRSSAVRSLRGLGGHAQLRTLSLDSGLGLSTKRFAPLLDLPELRCLRVKYNEGDAQPLSVLVSWTSLSQLPALLSLQIVIVTERAWDSEAVPTRALKIHAPAMLSRLEVRVEKGYGVPWGKPPAQLAYLPPDPDTGRDPCPHRPKLTGRAKHFMRLDSVEQRAPEEGLLAGGLFPGLRKLKVTGPACLLQGLQPQQFPALEWLGWSGPVGVWQVEHSAASARPAEPVAEVLARLAQINENEDAALKAYAKRRRWVAEGALEKQKGKGKPKKRTEADFERLAQDALATFRLALH